MRKLCAGLACFFLMYQGQAQSFPGFRTSRYAGVNGVFYNPASMANSPYKTDINVFGINTFIGNDNASFKLNALGDTFNSDSLSNQLTTGNNGSVSAFVDADIHGPSVMFHAGKKLSFAFTSRLRTQVNVRDIDAKLLDKLSDDLGNDPSLPYSFASTTNMSMRVNSWADLGVSAAMPVFQTGKHKISAGITAKYIVGMVNGSININSLKATINQNLLGDAYLTNASGRVAASFSGGSAGQVDAFNFSDITGHGFGLDLGLSYEIDDKDHRLIAGLAILDIGSVKYDRSTKSSGAYTIHIPANQAFYLNNLDGRDIDQYTAVFDSYPQFFTKDGSYAAGKYTVKLPTSVLVTADYQVIKGFSVNLSGQFASKSNDDSSPFLYNNISITPRIESKKLGAYLPVSFNSLTGTNAGAAFRLGPLYLGSGSIITALIGQSKQADVFIGTRIGLGAKKN